MRAILADGRLRFHAARPTAFGLEAHLATMHKLVREVRPHVVVIDPISLPYLQGSRIDFKDGLMGAGFSFENPNVQSTCGCNSSFQAKPEIEGPYSPKPGGCG